MVCTSFSEGIINRSGGQTMLYLTQYRPGTSRAYPALNIWVSGDYATSVCCVFYLFVLSIFLAGSIRII